MPWNPDAVKSTQTMLPNPVDTTIHTRMFKTIRMDGMSHEKTEGGTGGASTEE
jgi:hypothetical protein